MPDQNYSGMTVNERLFAAGLLDDFDAAVMRWDKEAVLNLLQKVEVPTRPLRPLMRCSRIPNFMGFPSGGDHGAAQGSSRCTAGARSYLCDADPGVFSGVAMRRIRSYHR